jgi:hypothetical protein
MDKITTLLDQIERLKRENQIETDPDLKRENKKTIKKLYREVRRAANPWSGLVRYVLYLLLIFVLGFYLVLKATQSVDLGSTALAGFLVIVALIFILCAVLLVRQHIGQDIFKEMAQVCIKAVAPLIGKKEVQKIETDSPNPLAPPVQPNRSLPERVIEDSSTPLGKVEGKSEE